MRAGTRRVAATAAALALALGAAACGGDDDTSGNATREEAVATATGAVRDVSEQGEPVDGGSITVGLEAETPGWLPGRSAFANSGISVAYALYDPLMKMGADGVVRPYLAESMEPDDDFGEWTLRLRPGIEFHDGTPLNAAALKSNFDDHLTAPGATTAGALDGVSMEVVDDLTVRYVLEEPDASFPSSLRLAPGWPFSPTAAAAAGDDAMSRPVGTGPFVFESWERDSELVVRRNPDYWQEGLPHLDEVVFRPLPDEQTRLASLTSGDVDVVMSLSSSSVLDLREVEGVDNYEQVGNTASVTLLNTEEPPLDDVRVRRALALATDQQGVIDVMGGGDVVPPATQMFGPDSPFYSEAVADAWYDYDPDAALDELQGYLDDPDRSDGRAPGEPIAVRYDCPPGPELTELAQYIQASWTAIGAEVELRSVEQATHVDEALSGDYQAKCFRVGLDSDPAAVLDGAFGEGSTTNFTRFTSPAVSEALEALRTTDDLPERQALVEEVMTIVNENVPMIYGGSTIGVVAAHDHVKNIDGWAFPDGTPGGTAAQGTVAWSHVWATG